MQSGGVISITTGSAPDANAVPIMKDDTERALDAAACIGFTITERVLAPAYASLRVGNPPGNPIHNCGAQHLATLDTLHHIAVVGPDIGESVYLTSPFGHTVALLEPDDSLR
jgi:hypothetical protein